MQYLAKSKNHETLIQHTNTLLKEFDVLKQTYPHIFTDQEWQLLQYACAYHDLGKINEHFQHKIRLNQRHDSAEIPHGLMSITMIPTHDLIKRFNFNRNQLKVLINSIAWHHERDFNQIDQHHYEAEIANMTNFEQDFAKNDLSQINLDLPLQKPCLVSKRYYTLAHRLAPADFGSVFDDNQALKLKYFMLYVKIKGLLNRIDYAASGHYQIESNKHINLSQNVLSTWQKDNPNASWNDLQKWTYQHRNQNIVVVAQTGLGKTESALRWLDHDKSFYVLPLKSAINSIYDRITNVVFQNDHQLIRNNVAILHSDMLAKNLLTEKKTSYQDFNKLVNEERNWSKQLSIATLDQIFMFVYHFKNYEANLATLSYAKVVIDEIQMYSPDLLAYLLFGLKQIQNFGGKFEIMTATLAPFVVDLMNNLGLDFVQSEHPFLDSQINHRHKVKVLHDDLTVEHILKLNRPGKTLIVCNTVNKAIELYQALKDRNVNNVHLIHSRFIRQDRLVKEHEILKFGDKHSRETGIWIGTQVVEASLDIDFDLLITELSELNSLFQRMGRCYRKRNYDGSSYNVYVFDGGDHATSGISRGQNSVVDYQMFSLSKQAIHDVDGYLTEQAKLDLINETYTSAKTSNFVKKVQNDINYLQATDDLHPAKAQVKQIFRNIQNIDVIPEQVYEDYQKQINHDVQIIVNSKNITDKKQVILARENLKNYLVSIPAYWIKNKDTDFIKNDELNKIGYYVLNKDFKYNVMTGLTMKSKKKASEIDHFL